MNREYFIGISSTLTIQCADKIVIVKPTEKGTSVIVTKKPNNIDSIAITVYPEKAPNIKALSNNNHTYFDSIKGKIKSFLLGGMYEGNKTK